LWKLQRDFEIDISVEFSPTFAGLTEMWANGSSWDDIRLATSMTKAMLLELYVVHSI